jgi:hypothetical protein
MSARTSHYIVAFTERNGPYQLAACGLWVRADEHSAEPTCDSCKTYVEDASSGATAEEVFGTFDPADVVKHQPFDPCSDYSERRR